MVKICRTVVGVKHKINCLRGDDLSVGFVPTMGALHEGHKSLMDRARLENDFVVCSIYANPTQFDNKEDLRKYPRTEEADLSLLQSASADLAFIPLTEDIYNGVNVLEVDYGVLTQSLEGAHRPGHFDGMTTIVRRLFDVVQPTRAYFGEKDFQQLAIIREMVRKEQMDLEVIGCAIVRDPDGLAMSSRNVRLSKEERCNALSISAFINSVKDLRKTHEPIDIEKKGLEILESNGLKPDYVKIVNARTLEKASEFSNDETYRVLVAAYCGSTRLIDNGEI